MIRLSTLSRPLTIRCSFFGLAATALIVITVGGGIFLGGKAIHLFEEIRIAWRHHDSVSEQKVRYLNQINRHLGFTGLSSHLKDYLLHGDEASLARIDIDLDQAKNAVESYKLLKISASELDALNGLGQMIRDTRKQVQSMPELRARGLTPAAIDTHTRANPSISVAALDQLRWAWREQARKTEAAMNAAADNGANLLYLGWGFLPAMIGVMGIVFRLVNRLRQQVVAYERERAALERSERKFRDMADTIPGVVFQWVEKPSGERGYMYVSPRCQELYGVAPEELQRNWRALNMPPEDMKRYLDSIQDASRNLKDWSFEGRVLTPNGEERWLRGVSKPVPQDGEEVVFNGVMIDISLQKTLEEELRKHATTDSLTGASNRRQFLCVAEAELHRALRYGKPMSVVMMDLDRFKAINDTFGHGGGDEVLRHVVKTVKAALREQDIIGRLGGEEFALMLPETSLHGANILSDRIRASIEKLQIPWLGTVIRVTASFGVAHLHDNDTGVRAMLARADACLYDAKNTGRNRVVTERAEDRDPQPSDPQPLSDARPGLHGVN
ncbi:MAG: diguanylate cyclase [Alphaproteobacteria bacterium]|nr:diguanylate cyclase [Alphaproteobacteria bacterium]